MLVIGMTGLIGSGKSTISKILAGKNIVDCDKIVHALYNKDKKLKSKIRELFGDSVFEGNKIDRKKLGEAAFSCPKKIRILDSIVHPLVVGEAKKLIRKFKKNKCKIAVIDAPLLFEAKMDCLCDLTIYVECSKAKRIIRMKRKGMSKKEIEKREKFLLPEARKKKLSDFVVSNSSALHKTKKQIVALISGFKEAGFYD